MASHPRKPKASKPRPPRAPAFEHSPGLLERLRQWGEQNPSVLRWGSLLLVYLAGLPALWKFTGLRYELFRRLPEQSGLADTVGFVNMAKTGFHFFYGWREPLFAQLILLTSWITGVGVDRAINILVFITSLLVLYLAPALAWRIAGVIPAIIFLYLQCYTRFFLTMFQLPERADAYLVFLLALWWLIYDRKWIALGVVAALATYLRVTTLTVMILTLGLLFVLTIDWRRVRENWPPKRPEGGSGRALLRRYRAQLIGLGCFLVLAAPLFLHYSIRFGSPVYPQTIITYDAYVYYKTQKWTVSVVGDFDRKYEIPDDFSYFQFFSGPADFREKMTLSAKRILFPFLLPAPPYWGLAFRWTYLFYGLGFAICLVHRPYRPVVAYFLGYSAPFLVLGFAEGIHHRYFGPTLLLAHLFVAIGLWQPVRWLVRGLNRPETGESRAAARTPRPAAERVKA